MGARPSTGAKDRPAQNEGAGSAPRVRQDAAAPARGVRPRTRQESMPQPPAESFSRLSKKNETTLWRSRVLKKSQEWGPSCGFLDKI